MSEEMFNEIYQTYNFKDDIELESYHLFLKIQEELNKRLVNKNQTYSKVTLAKYLLEEIKFNLTGFSKEPFKNVMQESFFQNQIIATVFDKFFFNELNPYHAISLVNKESPSISTMELYLNFIMNRLEVIKRNNEQKDILADMMSKAFLMFKSVNYLLINGSETEAFATWRTIHELECVIKVIFDNQYIIPIYLQHMVYNNAFRDEFEDKVAQQAIIDDLKAHMKEHDLKSKDMKKYIEYGWLYAVKDIEKKEGFKLNFRNGLELAASLDSYSQDYEMSSEVAHSSPLLIYSNKIFFKNVTILRSYESFLRLEEIFYSYLKSYKNIDSSSYEKMRNRYLGMVKNVLNSEISSLKNLINKN